MSKEKTIPAIVEFVLIVSMIFSFAMGCICGSFYESKRTSLTVQYTNFDGSHWKFTVKDKDVPGAKKQLEEEIKKYPNAKILP